MYTADYNGGSIMKRARLRELGIEIGNFPTGPHNAITDVPGVLVGHATIVMDKPRVARTGVTVILPRAGEIWRDHAFAAMHSFNGDGEMTGSHYVAEFGLLHTPIAITNTHQVGVVRDALVQHGHELGGADIFSLPVVAETYDGWLSDADGAHVRAQHVRAAIAEASSGPVAEGNVGGGTGMICHEFKGGIGTASRRVSSGGNTYTLGALVQANYGARHLLRVDGVPVGRTLDVKRIPSAWNEAAPAEGSIIVVLATDAPLLAVQCKRLAQRATVGLARVGGVGHNGSGDIFICFATGNHVPPKAQTEIALTMLPHAQLNPFFEAVAEVVEESILNALTSAETMTGFHGRVAHALPLDELQALMARRTTA